MITTAAAISGGTAVDREDATLAAPVPEGRVTVAGRVLSDPVVAWNGEGRVLTVRPTHLIGDGGWSSWRGPRLLVSGAEIEVAAGERVVAAGRLRKAPLHFRGEAVAARLEARWVRAIGPADDPLFAAGNVVRRRIRGGLAGFEPSPAAALLTGFLIGDVSELPPQDAEALRLTGLTHFVAVSGSNVALFLAAWWVATGPLGWGPRRRAAVGLAGLALFVVITRWEPSVLRAAAMASLVLAGRAAGIPVDGWLAYGGATSLLLLVSGGLAGNTGFQMSAAATAGVLAGAGLWSRRRPHWMWTAVGATISAQVAVAPLLLIHFGSIPLAAPLTNLIATPLVAGATALGGVGVLTGLTPSTSLGVAAADAVLRVARAGRDLPQLGWAGVGGLIALGVLSRKEGLRPLLALGLAAILAAAAVLPARPPPGPELTALDVGQGDALLLRDRRGTVILIDGGPDPLLLRRHLRRRGIGRIDLLVLTHEHGDHLGGLRGITDQVAVSTVWHTEAGTEEGVAALLDEFAASGASIHAPEVGWTADLGDFRIEVLGPLRRYASPNDGSLVLRVEAAGRTALLPGDIEMTAQHELGPLKADVLKVPHQGAATSDPAWLAEVQASVAVVCVGANTFGHPSPDVLWTLEASGAKIKRTDRDGNVVVRFDLLGKDADGGEAPTPGRKPGPAGRRRPAGRPVPAPRYRAAREADHRRHRAPRRRSR